MARTTEQIKAELSQLSVEERAELADFLIQSLETEVDDDAEAAWDAELERRMQDINCGIATGEIAPILAIAPDRSRSAPIKPHGKARTARQLGTKSEQS